MQEQGFDFMIMNEKVNFCKKKKKVKRKKERKNVSRCFPFIFPKECLL